MIAGGVFAAVVAAIVLSGGNNASSSTPAPPASDLGALAPTTAAAPLTTPVPQTAATIPRVPLTRTLSKGMTGDDVRRIQQRLKDLHFDPGPVDGVYGNNTRSAVWAFEKLVLKTPRADATGAITPESWSLMEGPVAIGPRRVNLGETHVEVYLPEQVAIVFKNDAPILITHISSGTGEEFREVVTIDPGEEGNIKGTEPLKKGVIGIAKTTGGTFTFDRRFKTGEDWKEGKLGRMYKPVYFNYGLAVHGAGNVPLEPASHGCVRIPMHIAEYFPDLVKRGDWIYLWDGEREPEEWGHQQPWFDRTDPDFSTSSTEPTTSLGAPSTSSSATTGPPTTKAAQVTAVDTTASPPPTTTTTTAVATTVPPPATTQPPATSAGGGAAGG